MFDSLFPKEWTTLQRLMWLKTNALARAVYEIITGNPVSFTAIAAPLKQLQIAFSPVQDLHGYDSPWPAGGGKNILPPRTYSSNIYNAGHLIPVSSGETVYVYGEWTYTSSSQMYVRVFNNEGETNKNGDGQDPTGPYFVSGTAKSFVMPIDGYFGICYNSGVSTYTIEKMMVSRSPIASPAGYSPYSNECPISGWDGVTVELTGKNLLTATEYCGIHYASGVGTDLKTTRAGISYTENGNEITVTAGGWQGWIFATGLLAAGDYYIHFNCNDSNFRGAAFVTDENLIVTRANITYGGGADGNTKITLTEPSRIALFVACGSSGSATITNLQVELGSSYTEWKPYNPSSRSISISFGSTVYSGTLDVLTGVVTVDMAEVDMSSLSWTTTTLNRWKTTSIGNAAKYPASTSVATGAISSSLKSVSMTTLNSNDTDTGIAFYNALDGVFARNGSTTQPPTGQLVYELATPITIQLTPQEVESLAGDNTMWTDAQNLEVTYRQN